MGDFENAEKTAFSQSPVKISREVLLVCAAEDGKAEEYRGEAILALLHELYQVMGNSVMTKHSISHSEEGLGTQLAIARLYESIFADGNCGFFHNDLCMIYLRCSFMAMHLKDSGRAQHYYEIALDHFLEFKKARATPQYTAPLVQKVKNYIPSIVLLDRGWFEESMRSFSFPAECVEAIRNNPKYASIFA